MTAGAIPLAVVQGRGVDVSKEPWRFSTRARIRHHYQEPNNFYTLRPTFGSEKLDFIVSRDLIQATKYHRILLKEWFYALKRGGTLVMAFTPTRTLNEATLIAEIQLCFGDRMKLQVEHFGREVVFILRKMKSAPTKDAGINRWTFGIITNGKRNEAVEQIIASIKAQRIPHFEIIVCGTYFKRPGIRYLPFTEKDDLGWITAKKNLICKAARYENIAVLHDRIALAPHWFSGMKRYGNHFDILVCPHFYQDKPLLSWGTTAYAYDDPRCRVLYPMEHADWDPWMPSGGAATIIKKQVWRAVPWDETLFWNQNEDLRQGHQAYRRGFLIRLNPHARFDSVAMPRGDNPPVILKIDSRRRGRLRGHPYHVLKKTAYQKWLNTKYRLRKSGTAP